MPEHPDDAEPLVVDVDEFADRVDLPPDLIRIAEKSVADVGADHADIAGHLLIHVVEDAPVLDDVLVEVQ